jgi:hypothetical protein
MGAMGFTWEYPLHLEIRRLALLDVLCGSAAALQAKIGAELLAGRPVPRVRPLG